ncbi:uncharacterized protein LOC118460414 [Anopheles albimanus]|uniref:uncharacterized protein LOC118460414 n=1 Tax=Anopheles albimanus TaxID=7167 RepID=UPI0016417537|nr:uncharacterized protein LOC118460414 [Anopheles albimanus]
MTYPGGSTILLLLSLSLPLALVRSETIKNFKVDRLNNCQPAELYDAAILPNCHISSELSANYINCTVRVKQAIEGPLRYQAKVYRCEMDLSKCEYFNAVDVADLCQRFDNAEFSERFLNNISPPLTCPVQPGEYQFNNNRWDMTAVVVLPGSSYRWKIATTLTQTVNERVVFCIEFMARIVILRKKANRQRIQVATL